MNKTAESSNKRVEPKCNLADEMGKNITKPKREEQVRYSQRYYDFTSEFRNVTIPREWVKEHKMIESMKILSELQWRKFIVQSKGWEHIGYSKGEPFILVFRRALGTDPRTGRFSSKLKEEHIMEERKRREEILARLVVLCQFR